MPDENQREQQVLTPEEVRYYLNVGGSFCPRCLSEDLEGASVDIDVGIAKQEVTCLACDFVWLDSYTLTDVCDEEGNAITPAYPLRLATPALVDEFCEAVEHYAVTADGVTTVICELRMLLTEALGQLNRGQWHDLLLQPEVLGVFDKTPELRHLLEKFKKI